MKRTIVSIAIIIGIVCLIVFKLAANKKEIDNRKKVDFSAASIAVTVAEVKYQSPESSISLVGNTVANREVTVSSKSTGEITQINFKLGDYVPKGAVLARVDDAYIRLALQNATINHNKFADDIKRFEALRADDAVSETQLRDVRVGYESTKVLLEQVQRQLEDTYIRAPFGGYITARFIELGKLVAPSAPIAGIADISSLKVLLSVTETNVYRLKRGQPVTVTTQIYPGISFIGRIDDISPQGDNAHSFSVEISLPNNTEHPLKAGTYVNVLIDMGKSQSVLVIPRDAIVSSVKDPAVYRIEGNIAKLIKITTGKDYENSIEVLQGLHEGDKVVINGQINLMDGVKVILN